MILNKFKKYALILYLIFAVIVLSRAFAHKKEQIAYKDSQGSISYTNPKILKKKCKNGDYNACAHHTELLGWLGKINIDEAYKRYQKYCDLGGGYGCMMIYSSIQGNSDGSYSKKKFNLLEKACQGNDSDGCMRLGNYYFYDAGQTKENIDRAMKYYEKGCEVLEDKMTCVILSQIYTYDTKFVKKSDELSKKYFELAEKFESYDEKNAVIMGTLKY
ncbi:hypothetical protein O6B96_02160 [Campylobacter ureolyticus]|uniref:hypothetical protein n=1 Tax=Campylobacter ureolyticus TaxID=827 RepID=UPI0022B2FCB6|nr:hypothetical protein [Campylobacter ureolyticus]MCZ6149858.1 hypothetical protein [Campylobacter ureolyticus]